MVAFRKTVLFLSVLSVGVATDTSRTNEEYDTYTHLQQSNRIGDDSRPWYVFYSIYVVFLPSQLHLPIFSFYSIQVFRSVFGLVA